MAGTWTALLSTWANKAISIARMNAYFSTSGNMQYLKDQLDALDAAAGRQLLEMAGCQSVVNSAAATDLISVSVPGGTMGANGSLESHLDYIVYNNTGGPLTIALALHYGTAVVKYFDDFSVADGLQYRGQIRAVITNYGAENTQAFSIVGTDVNSSGTIATRCSPIEAEAVDSTTAQTCKWVVQWSGANANAIFRQLAADIYHLVAS